MSAELAAVALRRANPGDGALIAELVAEHTAHEGATALGRAQDYDLGLADGVCGCVIAERDHDALGLAMFYPTFSSWSGQRGLFLEDLYVRSHARGLGVGRLLLAELARIARERGATRIDLVVRSGNDAAAFYARHGLGELPEWRLWRAEGTALARLGERR